MSKNIMYSFLGTQLDGGFTEKRLHRWRPNVGIAQSVDFVIDTLVLMFDQRHQALAEIVAQDARDLAVREGFEVELLPVDLNTHDENAHYDLAKCFDLMISIGERANFLPENNYYLNLSTGTHVMQIAAYRVCESNIWPAKLAQVGPDRDSENHASKISILDLSLPQYDKIMRRTRSQVVKEERALKNGIDTQNSAFNTMISKLLKIASRSSSPLVLMGPTGAGKTAMARRVYKVKNDTRRSLKRLEGPFVEVNCATLRGDTVMSTLFGHKKGAFTGAMESRDGMLKKANGGMLFLDEIGELAEDVQAMLLHALEDKSFFPVGADKAVNSDFELIVGTNRDLNECVELGLFRADLLARINTWTFTLPGLSERREDIEPNLDFELAKLSEKDQVHYQFVGGARHAYLSFARSEQAIWAGNFRDLVSSVERMVTLSDNGVITLDLVEDEIGMLTALWSARGKPHAAHATEDLVEQVLPGNSLNDFERGQLLAVLKHCRAASSNADLGRRVYGKDVGKNPSQRARDFLASHGLSLDEVKALIVAG